MRKKYCIWWVKTEPNKLKELMKKYKITTYGKNKLGVLKGSTHFSAILNGLRGTDLETAVKIVHMMTLKTAKKTIFDECFEKRD